MQLKPGSIIKITDEGEVKVLGAAGKAIDVADSAFKLASIHYRQALSDLWKSIHELYPELKGFQAYYNHLDREIIVRYKEVKEDES
jgi:hypothetical protein